MTKTDSKTHPFVRMMKDFPGMSDDFARVIVSIAEKEGGSYSEAFVKLAIAGAECRRLHDGR